MHFTYFIVCVCVCVYNSLILKSIVQQFWQVVQRIGDPNWSLKYQVSNLATKRRVEWDGSQLEGNLGLLEGRIYAESLEHQLLAKNLKHLGCLSPKKTRLEGNAIELEHSILQQEFGAKTDLQ